MMGNELIAEAAIKKVLGERLDLNLKDPTDKAVILNLVADEAEALLMTLLFDAIMACRAFSQQYLLELYPDCKS